MNNAGSDTAGTFIFSIDMVRIGDSTVLLLTEATAR